MADIHIIGRVVDHLSLRGLHGLRVEAWSKVTKVLVASGTTGSDGSFELAATLAHACSFRIYQDGALIHETNGDVDWSPAKKDPVTIAVPTGGGAHPSAGGGTATGLIVRGHVKTFSGDPAPGVTVKAVDKQMRSELPLGDASSPVVADRNGYYEIRYTHSQLDPKDNTAADLIVRAYDAKGNVLVASQIKFNAPDDATIDLTLPDANAQLSEFERMVAELAPVAQGVRPDQFTKDDIAFLSGETGQDSIRIQMLTTAYQLAVETELEPAVFYGMLREGVPSDFNALLSQGTARWRAALEKALTDDVIPAALGETLDRVIAELQTHAVQQTFQPPPQGQVSVCDLLATAGTTQQLNGDFLTRFVRHSGNLADFWKGLASVPQYQNGVAENIQMTLWLGAVSRAHIPLVKALQQRKQNGAFSSPRDLAKLEEGDWLSIITQHANGQTVGFPPDTPGANDQEKAAIYAHTLARTVETIFPTAVIAARVVKENAPQNKDLITFLTGNQDFDFKTDHVDVYLSATPNALKGVGNPGAFVSQLKGVQRVFVVTPRYSEMKVLLGDGLDSAQAITRMSRGQFLAKHGQTLGNYRANKVYGRAAQVAAAAMLVYGKYSPRFSTPLTVTGK